MRRVGPLHPGLSSGRASQQITAHIASRHAHGSKACQSEMGKILADASTVGKDTRDRRGDVGCRGVEFEVGKNPARKIPGRHQGWAALRKRGLGIINDLWCRLCRRRGRCAIYSVKIVRTALLFKKQRQDPVPGGAALTIQRLPRRHLNRRTRMHDEFGVLIVNAQNRIRVTEIVDEVSTSRWGRFDQEAMMPHSLPIHGSRRKMYYVLRLCNGRVVLVCGTMADLINHCRVPGRVATRCGSSSTSRK